MADVRIVTDTVTGVSCDVLVVNLFEGVTVPGGATGAVDRALDNLISQAIAAGDLTGTFGETVIFYTGGRIPARKVLVVGLGKAEKFNLPRVREVAAIAARAAARSGARTLATIAHGAGIGGLDPVQAARFTVEGSLYGAYRFKGYKTEDRRRKPDVETILLVERDGDRARAMAAGVEAARVVGEAVNWARDLVNAPANKMTPAALAAAARTMAAEVGLECEVLGPAEMERLGMGLLLAVSAGSAEPPACVVLRYRGPEPRGPRIALVGKGLTFDTGGYSLKPKDGMWEMKSDMAGGAAVLAAMQAVGRLRPPHADILAVVPCSENMVDGRAYRPGDVLKGLSGKTVEIRSTDAEGRLILADALAYAVREGAERIITVSTLTGGAEVALGHVRFAIMANDEAWGREVEAAVAAAGEKGWRLPADEEYFELTSSRIADMVNGHGRPAHTIQAGLFLFQHVQGVPTVHFDIAATAYRKEDRGHEGGATGVTVASLVEAVRRAGGGL